MKAVNFEHPSKRQARPGEKPSDAQVACEERKTASSPKSWSVFRATTLYVNTYTYTHSYRHACMHACYTLVYIGMHTHHPHVYLHIQMFVNTCIPRPLITLTKPLTQTTIRVLWVGAPRCPVASGISRK